MSDFQEDYQKMVKETLERGLENYRKQPILSCCSTSRKDRTFTLPPCGNSSLWFLRLAGLE